MKGQLKSEVSDEGLAFVVDYEVDIEEGEDSLFIDINRLGGDFPMAQAHLHLASDGKLTLTGLQFKGDFRNDEGELEEVHTMTLLPLQQEQEETAESLLEEACRELEQWHRTYHPDCKEGCPTLDIVERINKKRK